MKASLSDRVLAGRLAALAEPLRLRMLRVLEAEELSVGELASVLQVPQSTASRNLRTLETGGWVSRRQAGTIAGSNGSMHAEDARRLRAVLAQRRPDTQRYFARLAGRWDALRDDLYGRGFTPGALLSLISPGWTVLDAGCGTGNAAEWLAPRCARVIAADLSAPMLRAARRRLPDHDNVTFLRADVRDLPLGDASIDAAVCILVLHHLEHPAEALAELRRVLRPDGGALVLVDMVEHDREEYARTLGHRHLGFSRDQIERLLRDAGFSRARHAALPCDPSAKGPALFAARADCARTRPARTAPGRTNGRRRT
jgi:ubiquinone/menaquinone biosynthesis C-methylase UbiE